MAQLHSVSITGRQEMEGVTKYVIAVSDGTRSWMVLRRFREFEELHRALHYAMPGLPPMPEKSFWRKSFSGAFKDERQRKLCGLLQAMMAKDPQITMFQLRQFLQAPNPVPAIAQPLGGMQSQAMQAQALQQPACAPPAAVAAPVACQPGQPAYAAAQPVNVQPFAQPVSAQPVSAQPVYAQPVYAQPAAPVYAQPVIAQPQPLPPYGDSHVYSQHPHRHSHHHSHGAGMAVAAGVGGLAAGAVGGMMLERALEDRHRYNDVGFGGLGGFGGGFGGSDFREVRTDIFGDREVIDVRTDMFGDREVVDVRRDMFGNETITDVRTDMFGNTDVRTENIDMFGDVSVRDDFISGW